MHIKDTLPNQNMLVSRWLILASFECKISHIKHDSKTQRYMRSRHTPHPQINLLWKDFIAYKKVCGYLFSFMTTMHHYFSSLVIPYVFSMQLDSMDSFFMYPWAMSHVNVTLSFSSQWEINQLRGWFGLHYSRKILPWPIRK